MPEQGNEDFQQWFAKSTVRDEAGKPLVLYHGTDTKFSDFQYGEFGFHFGSLKAAKERGHILMEVHLLIENPIAFDTDFSTWDEEFIGPYLVERGVITEVEMNQGDLQGLLMDKGFDGYSYPNGFEGGGTSFAVFSPEQIKSIHHVGPYDRHSVNIHGQPATEPGPEANPRASGHDWGQGSQVVNDQGEMLVVFHGTKGTFNQFKVPAWFTPDYKMADHFSASPGQCDDEERTPDSKVMAVHLDIKNPLLTDDWHVTENLATRHEWRKEQMAAGHDGVKFTSEEGEVEYIAFHANQIRIVEGFDKKAAAEKALDFLHHLAPAMKAKP